MEQTHWLLKLGFLADIRKLNKTGKPLSSACPAAQVYVAAEGKATAEKPGVARLSAGKS
jgi:hypothetical protein